MVQPCMTSYAAIENEELGPGYVNAVVEKNIGPGMTETDGIWMKKNGVYVDDSGNQIEGAILRGVSVSKWQGDIDWGKVSADDVSFAMIRMGSFGYEGEYTMDAYYDKNMREAKANGVHVSPYVYLQTRTVEEAKAAARYTLEMAAAYDITYPIAVDVESQYIMDLSVQELTDVVNAFCKVIQEGGYKPIIYSDYSKFTTKMDISQFEYELWLARYGGDHNLTGRTIWQSTDKGSVDGISGNVCLEFAFKDYSAEQVVNRSDWTPGNWNKIDGKWYFDNNGSHYAGWIKPDGNWYYLDPAAGGVMVANTTMEINGVSYSFDARGAMK